MQALAVQIVAASREPAFPLSSFLDKIKQIVPPRCRKHPTLVELLSLLRVIATSPPDVVDGQRVTHLCGVVGEAILKEQQAWKEKQQRTKPIQATGGGKRSGRTDRMLPNGKRARRDSDDEYEPYQAPVKPPRCWRCRHPVMLPNDFNHRTKVHICTDCVLSERERNGRPLCNECIPRRGNPRTQQQLVA